MPSKYLGSRNSLPILEMRILPAPALNVGEELGSSGELLGLCLPCFLQAPGGGGAISQGRNPRGRTAISILDRPGAGRKQVSAKAEGKSDLHGVENSPPSWVFQRRAFEPFST